MKLYLGDSVYVEYEGETSCIVLTTENGYANDPRNLIVMEPSVVIAFTDFLERVASDYKKASPPQ